MKQYEFTWIVNRLDEWTPLALLNEYGALGWSAIGIISRPGVPERVLMQRELPPAANNAKVSPLKQLEKAKRENPKAFA